MPQTPNFDEQDVSDKPTWVRNLAFTDTDKAHYNEVYRTEADSLAAADEAIMALVEALRTSHKLNNTLFMVTSDNGFSWGSHKWMTKWCEYEECVKVFMMASYPKMIRLPREDNHLVANIDLAPTFLDLAGVKIPTSVNGKSLVPLFKSSVVPFRDAILIEGRTAIPFNDTCRNSSFCAMPSYSGVRTSQWKYVELKNGERELYDLVNDPYELENVVGRLENRTIVQGLVARLRELKAE
jgi:arylsulfatase A-like enzyme